MARILIIEDNTINMKLVSDLLEFEGHSILRASEAEQVQTMIRESPPDLILMDLALPGMDGLTLTRLLKAGRETMDIPVVALTAFAMKGDKRKALDAGCDGYITKPIDTRAFPNEVGSFLRGSRINP